MGPKTGGIALNFERGDTAKDRLRIDWVHPVPPERSQTETSAAGPLPFAEALSLLWENDERPLLVLRECNSCKDGDDALLNRAMNNDRTVLLTKWFRTVRLPAHVSENMHPFYRVFYDNRFPDMLPHFFLLAHPGASAVKFTGGQTPAQLQKGLLDVLGQRYAKDPAKAVKQWLAVLETFDALDAKRRLLNEQIDEARATDGPQSDKAKRLTEALAKCEAEREQALALEGKVRDLGLLPMPRVTASTAAAGK